MKFVAAFILILFSSTIFGQTKNLATLPTYDCSLKKIMGIIGSPTILVSPDKSIGLEPILNEYCTILGKNCVRKKESELTEIDLTNNLFLVGILTDFEKWKLYKTPISIMGKGFFLTTNLF